MDKSPCMLLMCNAILYRLLHLNTIWDCVMCVGRVTLVTNSPVVTKSDIGQQ